MSSDGNHIIVFNGEIYNYQELRSKLIESGVVFRTTSDTEVLLNTYILYGAKCLDLINGMFSFSILNKQDGNIFLARDRFGKKPLYYYLDSDTLVFSSETEPITQLDHIKDKLTVNTLAVQQVLQYGFIPGVDSIYNEIKRFPSACYAYFSLDSMEFIKINSYWNLESILNKTAASLSELDMLIEDSVNLRRPSDVSDCVFLSGGLDSSLVYLKALKSNPETPAFSIAYDNYIGDESKYAQDVARHLGGNCSLVHFSERDFQDYSLKILNGIDEPIADAAMIPLSYLCSQIKNSYKVALTGDGGDEIFGGYIKYKAQAILENTPKFVRKILTQLPLNFSSSQNFERISSVANCSFFERQFTFGSGGFLPHDVKNIVSNYHSLVSVNEKFEKFFNNGCSAYHKSMQYDIKYQLPDWYLYKSDRASMMQGIELRSPLLDYRLAEMVFGNVNLGLNKQLFSNKSIVKKLLLEKIPKRLVFRKKMGFAVSLDKFVNTSDAMDIAFVDKNSAYTRIKWIKQNYMKLSSLQKFKLITLNSFLSRKEFV